MSWADLKRGLRRKVPLSDDPGARLLRGIRPYSCRDDADVAEDEPPPARSRTSRGKRRHSGSGGDLRGRKKDTA